MESKESTLTTYKAGLEETFLLSLYFERQVLVILGVDAKRPNKNTTSAFFHHLLDKYEE